MGRELFPSACEPNVVLEQLADDSLAAAGREPCTLWLFPAYFNAPRWQRCAVISHEYGHLAGLEHSDNFRSIMYPQVTRYNAPAACVRSRAGYGTVRYDGRR